MLAPVVLYRHERTDPDQNAEIAAIREFMPVEEFRWRCAGRLVVGRYSVLPYYRDLEEELTSLGARLINSYEMHRWIASFDYYADLAPYTFESWSTLAETAHPGPFVVKGKTNSRKHQWDTHMFAATRADALRVAGELHNDSLIGTQGVVFRKYEPLRCFEVGINGMRFANEWRFFFFREHLLSRGYYWSLADKPELGECTPKMEAFAREVARVAAEHVNFFVLDVAEKEDGEMVLVEVNDAQMSGLSLNDPSGLYGNLASALRLADV